MADSPVLCSTTTLWSTVASWGPSLGEVLGRLATAAGAVIGLSAMAAQGGIGGAWLPDGTYLYGESPRADTTGATYFVFQVQNRTLSGGLYQPSSSFDCVYGTIEPHQLALTIVDAYDRSEVSYQVALTPAMAPLASATEARLRVDMEGMHPIASLSDLDHHILATCSR